MHRKCAVNGERKLPLKDVARMLGYFKICDTPQRSQVYLCVRFEEKREYETLLFEFIASAVFYLVRVKVHHLHFKICNFTSGKRYSGY